MGADHDNLLARLGVESLSCGVRGDRWLAEGPAIESSDPASGRTLARVVTASRADYDRVVESAGRAFESWRLRPAPARGELVRELGDALRCHKRELGALVTLEVGKIRSEGEGEVQEMIDMCDFATGLSRQLYGRTIASERPEHRLFEQWHPLGPVGVITAFNFPVAVWAWNAAIAAVCGDAVIWKPSPLAPLTAIAVQRIVDEVAERHDAAGVFNLCQDADGEVGRWMAADRRLPLISATGSCAMGRSVGSVVAARLGRSLLELGGNNAAILTPSANLDRALRAVLFASMGTAGQRCTTLRRLLVHTSIADQFLSQLVAAVRSIRVGDPLDDGVLLGPLIGEVAVERMLAAVAAAREQGGVVLCGGARLDRPGHFVQPTVIEVAADTPIMREETFAPILYVVRYERLDDAIAILNQTDQGLSSAIFTEQLREAEQFLSPAGSDCGIANVNIGTSGAEIGGAFGGEKDTGGGREAGSDAWKAYMRRQTCTVNYGAGLPLAQGVRFEFEERP